MTFRFPPYVIDVDVEKTRAFLKKNDALPAPCGCPACRNFRRYADNCPREIRTFFDALGLDIAKPSETFTDQALYADDAPTLRYGGVWHLCGTVTETDRHTETMEGGYTAIVTAGHRISEDFEISFHDECHSVPSAFPHPLLQMEITATLPKLLGESLYTKDLALYRSILAYLPSRSLRDAIDAQDYTVPDIDLLRTVCRYAPDFDTKLHLLRRLAELCPAEENRRLAQECVRYNIAVQESFASAAERCVYELDAEEYRPFTSDHYCCETLSAALDTLRAYCAAYPPKNGAPLPCFTVTKRPLRREGDPFPPPALEKAAYLPDGTLFRVESLSCFDCPQMPDIDCENCPLLCVRRADTQYFSTAPKFPAFLREGDLVSFPDHRKVYRHALVIDDSAGNGRLSEYMAIRLDWQADYTEKHILTSAHVHLLAPEIERITSDALTETERKNAATLRTLLASL